MDEYTICYEIMCADDSRVVNLSLADTLYRGDLVPEDVVGREQIKIRAVEDGRDFARPGPARRVLPQRRPAIVRPDRGCELPLSHPALDEGRPHPHPDLTRNRVDVG